MFRFLGFLILALFAIALLRGVIGILAKLFTGGASSSPARASRATGKAPTGGVLRKCSICGTYTPETLGLKRIQSGQTMFYCSADCERKAHPAA